MLAACEFQLGERRGRSSWPATGTPPDTRALLRALHRALRAQPDRAAGGFGEAPRAAGRRDPAIAGHGQLDGRATAYVCRNFACQLPVIRDVAEFAELLQ